MEGKPSLRLSRLGFAGPSRHRPARVSGLAPPGRDDGGGTVTSTPGAARSSFTSRSRQRWDSLRTQVTGNSDARAAARGAAALLLRHRLFRASAAARSPPVRLTLHYPAIGTTTPARLRLLQQLDLLDDPGPARRSTSSRRLSGSRPGSPGDVGVRRDSRPPSTGDAARQPDAQQARGRSTAGRRPMSRVLANCLRSGMRVTD